MYELFRSLPIINWYIISANSEVVCFYTLVTPCQMVLLFQNSKFTPNRFFINRPFLNWIRRKIETILPWGDHQCQVNLWKFRLWWHYPYTSEQVLINFPHLCREQLIIPNLIRLIVELSRVDICLEILMMSYHLSQLWEENMEQVYHVFEYIKKCYSSEMVFILVIL